MHMKPVNYNEQNQTWWNDLGSSRSCTEVEKCDSTTDTQTNGVLLQNSLPTYMQFKVLFSIKWTILACLDLKISNTNTQFFNIKHCRLRYLEEANKSGKAMTLITYHLEWLLVHQKYYPTFYKTLFDKTFALFSKSDWWPNFLKKVCGAKISIYNLCKTQISIH